MIEFQPSSCGIYINKSIFMIWESSVGLTIYSQKYTVVRRNNKQVKPNIWVTIYELNGMILTKYHAFEESLCKKNECVASIIVIVDEDSE